MYPGHTNCTCGEDQPNFNDRECREYYWNRRRRASGRHEDAIIEESSEHSSDERDEDVRDNRHHRGSSVSENFRKEKSVSRSSSGIGTATLSSRGQRKVSSDDTSSRCFSPSLKNEIIDELSDAEKDLNDNYEDDDLADLPHTEKKKRMKQLGDSRFGSLKTLKKALSKKSLFKGRNKKSRDENGEEDYQEDNDYSRKSSKESPKTPVLGKYSSKKMIEAVDDEFGSFTEDEEDTYSLSDYEEEEEEDGRHQNYEENYGRGGDQLRRRSKSYGNVSHDQERLEVTKPPRRHKSGTEGARHRHSSGPQGKYIKQYKGDILSSSEEDSESEGMARGGEVVRMNARKYSSQVREYSDYDEAKEEMLTDKPAINTLKKTFTAMLSRIGNSRMMGGTGDTSSDNISVNSRYSNALETRALADRPFTLMRRSGGGGLSRANSMASVRNNGKVVTDTGKKTFMYFSSDVGKGFIISDDEEVTGVISVMNMSRKKTKKIRDKITGTITDTLKRTNKRKKSKAAHDIPNFLFVNKPHFSSEESLNEGGAVVTSSIISGRDIIGTGGGAFSRPNSRGPSQPPSPSPGSSHRDRGKRYRSELMLRIPSRGNVNSEEEDEEDNYGYSPSSRDQRKKSRSRHSSQHHTSTRDDYYEQHEPAKKQDRHRRKKTT